MKPTWDPEAELEEIARSYRQPQLEETEHSYKVVHILNFPWPEHTFIGQKEMKVLPAMFFPVPDYFPFVMPNMVYAEYIEGHCPCLPSWDAKIRMWDTEVPVWHIPFSVREGFRAPTSIRSLLKAVETHRRVIPD